MINQYWISEKDMFLKNIFSPTEEIPDIITKLDQQEFSSIEQENDYIKKYSQRKFTFIKLSCIVIGAGIVTTIFSVVSAVFSSSLTLAMIDKIAYSGIFIGSILGYLMGFYADSTGSSTRMAMFFGRISQNRINRMTEKLEIVGKILNDDKENKQLILIEDKIKNILNEKGSYNRFLEFLNHNVKN